MSTQGKKWTMVVYALGEWWENSASSKGKAARSQGRKSMEGALSDGSCVMAESLQSMMSRTGNSTLEVRPMDLGVA